MKQKTKHLIYATATLVGYVIGAGIFGLPFVMQRMGYIPAVILMLILTVTTALNCLALTEILLRTRTFHCLSGLSKTYFKQRGKFIIFPILVGDFGSILAYGVLGGDFLKDMFGNPFPFDGAMLFAIFLLVGAVFIWRGYNHLGFSEIIMAAVLVGVMLLISGVSLKELQIANFAGMDFSKALPAFGVLLFSLDGTGGIFAIRRILAQRETSIYRSISNSYTVVFLLYVLFTVAIVGTFGANVYPEAILGIGTVFGSFMERAALVFGVIAVFSTYIVVGSNLRHALYDDLKVPKFYAWLLVWLVPLFIYMLGATNFIAIISVMGMFLAGFNTAIIVLLLQRARKHGTRIPEFRLKVPIFVNYIVAAAYIVATVYGIGEFFAG